MRQTACGCIVHFERLMRAGMRYVAGVEELLPTGLPFPTSVTKLLAEIVLAHRQHDDPTMSPRAKEVLGAICVAHPPARVSDPASAPPQHASMSQSQAVEAATGALIYSNCRSSSQTLEVRD